MERMLLSLSLVVAGIKVFAGGDAWAFPLESANPSASSPETEILDVTPKLRFSVDDRLRKNRDFWVSIYTQYDTHQGLIHDAKYIDLVYEAIDLTSSDVGGPPQNSRRIKNAKKHWKDVLFAVHRKQTHPETMTVDERRVFEMFRDIREPNKFINAAHRKRLRFQQGQKDHFLDGLKQSGRYLPLMEEIFRKAALPTELTRLPFVESSFNTRARSKVGASGIWQFMRSTGRLFLKINDAVDERNDPIRATEAAAKLLKGNFESLRQWPLAVTAYNHGRKGMMRAVRLVGSEELEDVVSSYRSRTFGFASSNFFCELLAAIEVEKNAEKYFGKKERAPLLSFYEVTIPDYIDIRQLAQFMKLDLAVLKEYNPGLTENVFAGTRLIPAGYQLRLPFDSAAPSAPAASPEAARDSAARVFLAGYTQIPGIYKLRTQIHGKTTTKARSVSRRVNRARRGTSRQSL